MLGRVIPALIEDRDRLRQTLEARERECEQLRGEGGELRRNLGALQSEVEKLRGERVAMADAFGGVVDLLGQRSEERRVGKEEKPRWKTREGMNTSRRSMSDHVPVW